MKRRKITTLLFDNNGVLTTSDKERTYRVTSNFLRVPIPSIIRAFSPYVKRLDTGKLEQNQFYRNVLGSLGKTDISIREFRRVHLNGYQPKPKVIAFAKQFKGRFCMALLSNFGKAFWLEDRRWKLERIFQKKRMFVSSDIGLCKPDRRAFLYALRKLGKKPEEVVFIDDNAKNILAARELHMHTIRFRNLKDCRKKLSSLLQRCM